MNRKSFLSALIPVGLTLSSWKEFGTALADRKTGSRIPPYLKPGDVIGITCPAGYISLDDLQPALKVMESWGFRTIIGRTVGCRDFSLGGSDKERLSDMQDMLDNNDIKAIMCARGGYGSLRIVDKLNFHKFCAHPKWMIGFSDITVLHCHISRNFGIATIHSKMCNSFPTVWENAEPEQIATIDSIREALSGKPMQYRAASNPFNRKGTTEGVLTGGNLRTIENLAGTHSEIITRNKILFIEDTGEYLYSIDRMLWNLKRSGKLEALKGLIVGGFRIKPDDPDEEFGKTLYEIVMEKVSEYSYPVCFDFPVGHQKNNYALRCGVKHLLHVSTEGVSLTSTPIS